MKIERRKFRIGELAQRLEVERFVVRFWEKEFNIKSTRSQGRQRFYEEKDYKTFKQIKHLLYEEGFTIAGAKKYLKNPVSTTIIASQKTTIDDTDQNTTVEKLTAQISTLKKQLAKLREQV